MLNLSVAAAEEDIDLESFGKKKKKKKVTIEDDEEGGGEKDDGAVDGEFDFVNLVVLCGRLIRKTYFCLKFSYPLRNKVNIDTSPFFYRRHRSRVIRQEEEEKEEGGAELGGARRGAAQRGVYVKFCSVQI